jgi:hypothetical protein
MDIGSQRRGGRPELWERKEGRPLRLRAGQNPEGSV